MTSRLQEAVNFSARKLGVVGATAALLHGDNLTTAVTGQANVATGIPVTPDTLFQVGSTTKLFNAAMLLRLADMGSIDLDRPIIEYLTDFSLCDVAATTSVTCRQLLSMTSGMDNGPYSNFGRGADAVQLYVKSLAEIPHAFTPGSRYGYSNASSIVAGRVAEVITGHSWDDLIRDLILVPAGLTDTLTVPEHVMLRRFSLGYHRHEQGDVSVVPRWAWARSMGPAGATLCSTATDLVRFAAILLNHGEGAERRVLSEDAVAAMHGCEIEIEPTGEADWWGLGPSGRFWNGLAVHGHGGTNTGGSSVLTWIPERGIAIATIVNTASLGYPFARAVAAAVLPELGITPEYSLIPSPDVQVDVDAFVGDYTMFGLTIQIKADNKGQLVATSSEALPFYDKPIGTVKLLPVTETSFLPADNAISGGRDWGIAFAGVPGQRADYMINGLWAMRRVETSR
jgi:CubicO group peptidase (beta-lactamase class C family)